MRHVLTNAQLEAVHRAGTGYIFNDFTSGPAAARDNVLHEATCTWVRRMLRGSDPGSPPSVRKIFFDTFDEATSWLTRHHGSAGSGWKPCGTCKPAGPADDCPATSDDEAWPGRQAGPQTAVLDQGSGVFREAEVERLLYAHLRQAGYVVREKVPVTSGIVDAIATRDGKRVVIEIKGEDAGGYGSAQMNLQMAFGQISSRMTDSGATYAIAFPVTPHYLKALRAFGASLAFQRLSLTCYLVQRDGNVREIRPWQARAWIGQWPHAHADLARDTLPDRETVLEAVLAAMRDVATRDRILLALQAHELAIVHRFAVYLESRLQHDLRRCGLTIDLDYDRRGDKPKRLPPRPDRKRGDPRRFRPDLIVRCACRTDAMR